MVQPKRKANKPITEATQNNLTRIKTTKKEITKLTQSKTKTKKGKITKAKTGTRGKRTVLQDLPKNQSEMINEESSDHNERSTHSPASMNSQDPDPTQVPLRQIHPVSSDEALVEAHTPENLPTPPPASQHDGSMTNFDLMSEFPWLQVNPDHIMTAPEYDEDYFKNFKESELRYIPKNDSAETQPYITPESRIALMNWIIGLHSHFELTPETLYMAVNLLERCFTKRIVKSDTLDLFAITCLFISAKYEEVYPPSLNNFVEQLPGQHNATAVKKAEVYILSLNNYDLEYPNPMSFMRRINRADQLDDGIRATTKFILETTLYYSDFVLYPISKLTAASYYVAIFVNDSKNWSRAHEYVSGYRASDLKEVVDMIVSRIRNLDPSTAVYIKYNSQDFGQASLIVCQNLGSFLGPLPQF